MRCHGLPRGPGQQSDTERTPAGQPVDGAGELRRGVQGRVLLVEHPPYVLGLQRGHLHGQRTGGDLGGTGPGGGVGDLGEETADGGTQRRVVVPAQRPHEDGLVVKAGGPVPEDGLQQAPPERCLNVVEEYERPPDVPQIAHPRVGGLQVGAQRPDEMALGEGAGVGVALAAELQGEEIEPAFGVAAGAGVVPVPGDGLALAAVEEVLQERLDGRLDDDVETGRGPRPQCGELGRDLDDPAAPGVPEPRPGLHEHPEAHGLVAYALTVVRVPARGGDGDQPGGQAREFDVAGAAHGRPELLAEHGERLGHGGPVGRARVPGGQSGEVGVLAVDQGDGGALAVVVAELFEQDGLARTAAAGDDDDRQVLRMLGFHLLEPAGRQPDEPGRESVENGLAAEQLSVQAAPPEPGVGSRRCRNTSLSGASWNQYTLSDHPNSVDRGCMISRLTG